MLKLQGCLEGYIILCYICARELTKDYVINLMTKNMEEVKGKNEMKKTQVFNVVILDRSGSMSSIRRAALEGFNETLAGIKKAQEKYADTQEHYVSLVSFCSCEMRKVYDKTPVAETRPLTMADYEPCCCTPLYDAMGFTLTDMHKHVKDMDDATVVVAVITDGMENDSHEYDARAIKALVERLRGEGWSFTYMGTNQDAMVEAGKMSIRNFRQFEDTDEGVRETWKSESAYRSRLYDKIDAVNCCCMEAPISREERRKRYSELSDEAFDEEEKKKGTNPY